MDQPRPPSPRAQKRLEDLPNELLFEILKHLDVGDSQGHFAFNVFHVLPRVSQRFRSIAQAYWRRRHKFFHDLAAFERQVKISEPDYYRLSARQVEEVQGSGMSWDKQAIRSICVGRLQYPICGEQFESKKPLALPLAFLEMPNLESWTVWDAAEQPPGLYCLSLPRHAPRIKHLGLLWTWANCVPCVEEFANLQSLRIIASARRALQRRAVVQPYRVITVTVTTLAVHEVSPDETLIRDFCDGARFTFPNLRVLHFADTNTPVPEVYDFIRRHDTLREVNVSFDRWTARPLASLRLEALVKLIDGTGHWIRAENQSSHLVDQPSFAQYVAHAEVPRDFVYNWGAFYELAFSRAPIPGAVGPQQPRYICTALAIKFLEKDDGFRLTSQLPADVWSFMVPDQDRGSPGHLLSSVQELRLSFAIEQDTVYTFSDEMEKLANGVRAMPSLRKLALNWPVTHAYWDCMYDDPYRVRDPGTRYICSACEPFRVPFLDWLAPPFFYWTCEPMTLYRLSLSSLEHDVDELGMERLEDTIRLVLLLDEDTPLDRDDPDLLFRAWEARNYPMVSMWVKILAGLAPDLEELDWYVAHALDGVVLWKWRVLRNKDGSVNRANGHLWWTSCARGDPPPFMALVGQELEHTVQDARGQWRYC
ncbi:F-box protein [Phanerochaete sordida]|uniref:F-box protein n=1 Tax=Phanerochaete sordida TaxID=48140 RepID=A0A9P3FZ12_9APHY|nr:F-box protein [Phanerochaete sordida]